MMSPLKSEETAHDERRHADRIGFDNSRVIVQVTSVLEQGMHSAWILDLSRDGQGMCLVLEPWFPPGSRLFLELCNRRGLAVQRWWAEVKHSDICCPSFVEMYMHGCRLSEPLSTEKINPRH
jgi:hypothetical protein